TDTAQHGAIIGASETSAAKIFRQIDEALADGPYLLGQEFSAADIMLGFTIWSASISGILDFARFPRTAAYLKLLKARPGFANALAASKKVAEDLRVSADD
ncbi:MAG: glutathione S-transferase C-terminal domain-containing protein, partial [Pacificimonas sp.]